MRVAPVGVLYPPERMDELIHAAYESSLPTHGGQMAICAATAVAGSISTALEGRAAGDVLAAAIAAAREAEKFRPAPREITLAASIERIYSDISANNGLGMDGPVARHFPDNPSTIVPLAISLAVATQSAERTILIGANAGGDSDSVASIGAAISAAMHPETVNQEWVRTVAEINRHDLAGFAVSLAGRRSYKQT